MSKQYPRKRQVAARYGVTEREIERRVVQGKLRKPFYMPGSRIPLWDEEQLDADDARVINEASA